MKTKVPIKRRRAAKTARRVVTASNRSSRDADERQQAEFWMQFMRRRFFQ